MDYLKKTQGIFLINLAGFPAQISPLGMDLVTTEPAPIMERAPIVTPFRIIVPAPMKQSSSKVIGAELRCSLSIVQSRLYS